MNAKTAPERLRGRCECKWLSGGGENIIDVAVFSGEAREVETGGILV